MIIPGGGILSNNVQDAIEEINDNKVSKSGDTITGNLSLVKSNTGTGAVDSRLYLGNDIPAGTTGATRGVISIYDTNQFKVNLLAGGTTLTADRDITLPNRSGEIAFTNQLPTIYKRLLRATSASFGNIPGNCMGIVTFRNYQGAGDQDIYMRHFLVTSDSAVLDKVLINTGNVTITGLSVSYNSTNSAITFSWTNEYSYFISILIFPMS